MKRKFLLLSVAVLSTLNAQLSTLFAQGILTPPGAPAPTMKSLDQIEARTPISSAPYTISQPGSYYLTNNVTVSSGDAITINTNNVSLDLNGFAISSSANPAQGRAIFLATVTNVTILNGFVGSPLTGCSSGFNNAIYSATLPVNVRVSGVLVAGCQGTAIYLAGSNNTVENCTVYNAGGNGISAKSITNSIAIACEYTAVVGDIATNCRGESIGGGGISASIVTDCYGRGGGNGDGIFANKASNCYGVGSGTGTGVVAAIANGCYGTSTNGRGIAADQASNCYGYASGTAPGVDAYAANGCNGTSVHGRGVSAYTADHCYGSSSDNFGIYASIATGSYGFTGTYWGVWADVAFSCYGVANNGIGLHYEKIAAMCYARQNSTGNWHYILGGGALGPGNMGL